MHIRHAKQQVSKQPCSNIQLSSEIIGVSYSLVWLDLVSIPKSPSLDADASPLGRRRFLREFMESLQTNGPEEDRELACTGHEQINNIVK